MNHGRVYNSLPIGYLRKPGGKWRYIRLLDLAILLYNLQVAYDDPDIGFEDADETYQGMLKILNKWVLCNPIKIESALWASNMVNDKEKFVHPKGYTFDEFVADMLRGRADFDKFYNTVTWKEKKNYGKYTEPSPANKNKPG